MNYRGSTLAEPKHRQRVAGAAFVTGKEIFVVECGQHRVRRLGIVLHVELAAHGRNRPRHRVAEALVDRIDQVHAPVSHGAPRVIPEVSECRETGSFNAPAIRIEGNLWRGSEPQIPIEIRWWIAVRGIAEALLFRHPRSEERRVGEECRYRWAPAH